MDKIEQLKSFIYQQIQSGINPDEIATQLRTAGWDEASITSAFSAVQVQIVPTVPPATAMTPAHPGQPGNPTQPAYASQPATNFQASGKKRGRIKTAWLLMKQSLKVLKNNKQLLRYPFMAILMSLLVTIPFIIIVIAGGDAVYTERKDVFGDDDIELKPVGLALAFIYYVVAYFVLFIYNAGLAAHVLDLFRGKSQGYKYYMAIAWSKKKPIFVYSVISATVGIILQFIEQRARWLGFIVSRILGAAWTLANLFTIPVIVESDISAPGAIKQSAKLFISRWGENVAARIGFGGLMFLIYLLIVFPFLILVAVLSSLLGAAGIFLFIIIALIAILLFITIETAASNVLSTALYFYAKYEQVPAAYDQELLNAALVPKKQRRGLFGKKQSPKPDN